MKKTNRTVFLILLLVLIAVITSWYVASTYAKYTATVAKSGTATIATWAFETDNTSSSTFTIGRNGTIDESTLVNGKIAPGTSGSFNIVIANTNSDVGVDFTMTFTGATGIPTNLVLKAIPTGGSETVFTSASTITGQIEKGQTLTIPVTWIWAYETGTTPFTEGDAADTTNGTAETRTMTISASVVAVQTEPGSAISNSFTISND